MGKLPRTIVVAALGAAFAASALAGEGVIEINQASALAGGVTTGDTAGFPVTLNDPGAYRLTGGLDSTGTPSPQNVSLIAIAADRVTLDLGGFTLRGPTVCTGAGATIACTPVGTGAGISASGVSDLTVRNGRVEGSGGVGIFVGARGRVEDVTVQSCGGTGISCGVGCLLRRVLSAQNASNGVSLDEGSAVFESAVLDNGGQGILANVGGALLRHNVASGNRFSGVVGHGGALLLGNVAVSNGTGLSLGAATEAGFSDNVTSGNPSGNVSGVGVNLGGNACGGALCP